MVVRAEPRPKPSQRTRHRYILFRLVEPVGLDRQAFIQALRQAGASGTSQEAWLTRYDGVHGILRCPRGHERDVARRLGDPLRGVGVVVQTLSTSGTIAALERRHPQLRLPNRGS